MNIFLPIPHNGATRNGHNERTGEGCAKAKEEEGGGGSGEGGGGSGEGGAVPIDFQWTGMGMGMLDVAMHLYHSVGLEAMVDGGEERLLRFYHRCLTERIGPDKALRYPFHTAMRHYRICLVDYARVVLSCFFKGASPASFAAKAEKENCGLVYRHLGCAMRFVEEVEKAVSFLEAEEGKGGGLTLDETRGGQGRRRGRGAGRGNGGGGGGGESGRRGSSSSSDASTAKAQASLLAPLHTTRTVVHLVPPEIVASLTTGQRRIANYAALAFPTILVSRIESQ